MTRRNFRHLLRRPLGDDLAAGVPALGPQVDDVVGGLDDVQVVLDDDDGVPFGDEVVKDCNQPLTSSK